MTQKKVWVILLSRKDHGIQDKDDQKEGSSKKKSFYIYIFAVETCPIIIHTSTCLNQSN